VDKLDNFFLGLGIGAAVGVRFADYRQNRARARQFRDNLAPRSNTIIGSRVRCAPSINNVALNFREPDLERSEVEPVFDLAVDLTRVDVMRPAERVAGVEQVTRVGDIHRVGRQHYVLAERLADGEIERRVGPAGAHAPHPERCLIVAFSAARIIQKLELPENQGRNRGGE
jgi:hypothetical protein